MDRKLISKAIGDLDDAFIVEALRPPVADRSPERTKNMGRYEVKKRSGGRRLAGIILAACLVFALAAGAYAMDLFGIRELLRSQDRELPAEAEPYIRQHTEGAEKEGWSASVMESLCDSGKAVVTVRVCGGDKYIIVPTDASPEHRVEVLGIEGDKTLGEYAAEQGKELLCVSASLRRNEHLGIVAEHILFESVSESEMVILVEADRTGAEEAGSAVCWVYAVDEAGALETLEIPVELTQAPTASRADFVPKDPAAIPGITVVGATVEETPLGLTVRIITEADQPDLKGIKWMAAKELTHFEGGGFVLEEDGTWSTTWTMGKGEIGDTFTVYYYDWDDCQIGQILFMKQ